MRTMIFGSLVKIAFEENFKEHDFSFAMIGTEFEVYGLLLHVI